MPFTTSQATTILQSIIKSTTYIGLSTTTPSASGDGFAEPAAASGYERSKFGDLDVSIKAQIANKDIIFFNESVNGGYGTVTHFGLFTDKGGSAPPFFTGALESTMFIGDGYVPIFRKRQLVIGLDKASLEPYPADN